MSTQLYASPEQQLIKVKMMKIKKGLFGRAKYLVAYNHTIMDGSKALYTKSLSGWVKNIYTFDGNNYKELSRDEVEQYV